MASRPQHNFPTASATLGTSASFSADSRTAFNRGKEEKILQIVVGSISSSLTKLIDLYSNFDPSNKNHCSLVSKKYRDETILTTRVLELRRSLSLLDPEIINTRNYENRLLLARDAIKTLMICSKGVKRNAILDKNISKSIKALKKLMFKSGLKSAGKDISNKTKAATLMASIGIGWLLAGEARVANPNSLLTSSTPAVSGNNQQAESLSEKLLNETRSSPSIEIVVPKEPAPSRNSRRSYAKASPATPIRGTKHKSRWPLSSQTQSIQDNLYKLVSSKEQLRVECGFVEHKILPGESLYKIASLPIHQSTVADICRANEWRSPLEFVKISKGSIILIPQGSALRTTEAQDIKSAKFNSEVIKGCLARGINPSHFLSFLSYQSNLNPTFVREKNESEGIQAGFGLCSLSEGQCRSVGILPEELLKMSPTDQLQYVFAVIDRALDAARKEAGNKSASPSGLGGLVMLFQDPAFACLGVNAPYVMRGELISSTPVSSLPQDCKNYLSKNGDTPANRARLSAIHQSKYEAYSHLDVDRKGFVTVADIANGLKFSNVSSSVGEFGQLYLEYWQQPN
jgi:hypothetical protein